MLPPGASFLHLSLWGYGVPIQGYFPQCVIVAANDWTILSFTYLFPWVVYDSCHLSEQPTRNRVPLLYRQTTPPTSHESLCLGRPDDPPNPSETKLTQMCKTLCILCSLMSNAGAFATTFLGSFLFAPNMQLCTTYM